MNHFAHWTESPHFIARPDDTRLRRIYVFRLKDPRRKELAWTVVHQTRNNHQLNWRSEHIFHYDTHKQALMFAKLVTEEFK